MLMEKALAKVTVEEWVNAIKYTEKVEEEYWRMDFFAQNAHYLSIDLNETVNEQSNWRNH